MSEALESWETELLEEALAEEAVRREDRAASWTETVTLLNRRYDPASRRDVWKRVVVRGVSWREAQETVAGTGGNILRENVAYLRIPKSAETEGKTYVPAGLYAGAEGTWTLQNGDYVALGTREEPEAGEAMGKRMRETGAYQIVGLADNRRGGLPHWRVTGKG